MQVIASKYMNDEGELEALTNSEWAELGMSTMFASVPVTYFCVLVVPHRGMLSVKVIKLQERDSQWTFNLSERVFNSYHSTESFDAVALGHTTPD